MLYFPTISTGPQGPYSPTYHYATPAKPLPIPVPTASTGRRNRRRERPGSRTRNSQPKPHSHAAVHSDDSRGRDMTAPTYSPSPSPLLRQSFDAAWLRWKATEASSYGTPSNSNPIPTYGSSPGFSYGSYGSSPVPGHGSSVQDEWRGGEKALKIEERRIFGGDEEECGVGRGLDLCPAMLDVVKFLWGDVDYTDP